MSDTENKIGKMRFASLSSEGGIPAYGQQLTQIARPGVDGVIFLRQGRRGEPFAVRSVATFDRLRQANTAIDEYEKMRATVQDLVMQNRVYSKVMILNVRCLPPAELVASSDDTSYQVICNWEMMLNE